MNKHTCELPKPVGYIIQQTPTKIWYVYDELAHTYLFGIKYCPFCGEKLDV